MLNHAQMEMTQNTNKHPRDYGFDNIRAILIACVVLGHLLEVCTPFRGHRFIYQTIYSFHVPIFIFISGYFARYNAKKVLFSWVFPLFIFQILYITVERLLNINTTFQFSTPYWHLWFLLVCIFYQFLIPAYETTSFPKQILALICVTILSVVTGFDKTMGHYMALSRFFVFQPWFLLGYYFRKYHARQPEILFTKRKVLHSGVIIVVLCISIIAIYKCNLPNKIFYGSYPYDNVPTDLIYRLIVMLASFVWLVFFVKILRPLMQKKIPLITTLGQNTLPVYTLHAFATKGIDAKFPSLLSSPIYLIMITAAILFLFGNPFIGKIFRFLFSDGIMKIFSKKVKTGG